MLRRSRQNGMTLLELIVTLGLMGWAIVGVSMLAERYSEDTTAAVTSQQMTTIASAAQSYIKDNWITVSAVATPTTPALITVSALISSGYLNNGIQSINSKGQHICVLILNPGGNTLHGAVVAEGGTEFDDLTLGAVAGMIGASGGGIYTSDPLVMRGSIGNWATPIGNFANPNASGVRCDGATGGAVTLTPGHPVVALWFDNKETTSPLLYRNSVGGRPELNQMQTQLDMNGKDISNTLTLGMTPDSTVKINDSCAGNEGKIKYTNQRQCCLAIDPTTKLCTGGVSTVTLAKPEPVICYKGHDTAADVLPEC